MAANVKIVKLITTEELLAEVKNETETKVTLKNPTRIVVIPPQGGQSPKGTNVGLAPWINFSDETEVTIDKSHIFCIMNPAQEFVNQYNTVFGGLVAPSSKLII